jgi:myosin heavy subunit
MSADSTSDSDSDGEEFHDATPITRELDELLSHEAGHGGSPEDTSAHEFERLRQLLAQRSAEIARLVKELEEAKQVHKDGVAWAEDLQAEVEARLAADARLELEMDAQTEAAAQAKAMRDENAKLKSAEAVAFAELLDLQAKYEDADEAKRSAEAALAERRSDEMHALAQIMELQAKYEEVEEAKTELEERLVEVDERSQARGQREAELAGMGHGRTKAAASAIGHALEIVQFYEAEVASLRKSLEREVLLRNEQKQELEREVILRMATESELACVEAVDRPGTIAGSPASVVFDSSGAHASAIPAQLELDLTPRGTRAET